MNKNKKKLYQKALEVFGEKGLFRTSAVKLNDLSMTLLEHIKNQEPIENDEDFFDSLADAYICVGRLCDMLDVGPHQKLLTTIHYKLNQLEGQVQAQAEK
jgi:hypothetical protein